SAIAEHRNNLERLAVQIARDRHAVARRDRGAGVASAERIVLTLAALEKTRQTVFLPQRLQSVGAPGQEFVRIALVPNVPDQLVAGRIEHCVERNGQLDDAQSCPDVAASPRADFDESRAHLFGDYAQLVAGHGLQIGWSMYSVEDRHSGMVVRTFGLP